jgi:hypothetical protein
MLSASLERLLVLVWSLPQPASSKPAIAAISRDFEALYFIIGISL